MTTLAAPVPMPSAPLVYVSQWLMMADPTRMPYPLLPETRKLSNCEFLALGMSMPLVQPRTAPLRMTMFSRTPEVKIPEPVPTPVSVKPMRSTVTSFA